jgi:hypothetical protein
VPKAIVVTQEKISAFKDTFPNYPLMVRGIRLYVLWQTTHTQSSPTSFAIPATFMRRSLVLGAWSTVDIFQRPGPDGSGIDEPWLPAQEALHMVVQLLQSLAAHSTENQPAYVIVNIREFSTARPHAFRQARQQELDRAHVSRQKEFVECLEERVRAHLKPISREPQAFEHYDRRVKRRGWLVFASMWALLCNVESAEARVLADIIQPQEISTKHGGIASDHYDEVLRRVGQWNSTQDFFEAVSRLEELAVGGEISTRGQLWLNFSLACIGVLLSIVGIGFFGLPLVGHLSRLLPF